MTRQELAAPHFATSRSSIEPPRKSSCNRLKTSPTSAESPSHASPEIAPVCPPASPPPREKASGLAASERYPSYSPATSHTRVKPLPASRRSLAHLMRQPRLRRAPIAQHRRFGNSNSSAVSAMSTRQKTDLHHHRLPRIHPLEPNQAPYSARAIPSPASFLSPRYRLHRNCRPAAALPRFRRRAASTNNCRIARAAMRLKCSRDVDRNIRRFRQFDPRFIHQRGRT